MKYLIIPVLFHRVVTGRGRILRLPTSFSRKELSECLIRGHRRYMRIRETSGSDMTTQDQYASKQNGRNRMD